MSILFAITILFDSLIICTCIKSMLFAKQLFYVFRLLKIIFSSLNFIINHKIYLMLSYSSKVLFDFCVARKNREKRHYPQLIKICKRLEKRYNASVSRELRY